VLILGRGFTASGTAACSSKYNKAASGTRDLCRGAACCAPICLCPPPPSSQHVPHDGLRCRYGPKLSRQRTCARSPADSANRTVPSRAFLSSCIAAMEIVHSSPTAATRVATRSVPAALQRSAVPASAIPEPRRDALRRPCRLRPASPCSVANFEVASIACATVCRSSKIARLPPLVHPLPRPPP